MYTSANWPYCTMQLIQINVASLSCVRACKIKHFTEREFSGIFSFAGGGILRFQNGNSRWPWFCHPLHLHKVDITSDCFHIGFYSRVTTYWSFSIVLSSLRSHCSPVVSTKMIQVAVQDVNVVNQDLQQRHLLTLEVCYIFFDGNEGISLLSNIFLVDICQL